MPKTLNNTVIQRAKPRAAPYKIADLNRLHVLVSASGSKTWRWSFLLDGKDHTLTLGQFPDVDVAEARERRAAAQKLVAQGIDPRAHAQQQVAKTKIEQATTFGGIALEWTESNAPAEDDPNPKQPGKWSKYYAQQVRNFMGRYVIDAPLGKKPIRSVTSADIFQLVQSVATRKSGAVGEERKAKGAPSVAVLIKQWSAAVFALAIATQRADANPATGFKTSLAVKKPKTKHNKALDEQGLRDVLAALDSYKGQRATVIAIELLLLTAVRTVELRKACWPEFNFIAATWTIPGERMKMGLPHVVPLSTQAIALLQELRLINPPPKTGLQWLFPNRRRNSSNRKPDAEPHMSATTINRALGNMGFNGDRLFRAHGARGTASTHLNDADFDYRHIEAALAHEVKGTAGAYNKAKHLKQRRAMMQSYADYVDGLRADSELHVLTNSNLAI